MAAPRRLLIPALLLGLACVQDDGTRFNPLRRLIGGQVSQEDEATLGYEFDRAAREQLDWIEDPTVVGFLTDLGQEMVATIEPQPFIYRFRVISDPRLNAFAVPGGYVYMHSGTILQATTIDELAGVMGHEIAHVKERHYARMREQNAVPALLTQLAAFGASAATGSPAPLVFAAGINVALELRYSRQFENEADHFGAIFMTRVGYDVRGLSHFFERLVAEESRPSGAIPPYLYTHPDVEARIEAVEAAAETLRPVKEPDPALTEAFYEAQARLALLIDTGRSIWLRPTSQADRSRSDPFLERANQVAADGQLERALATLREGEALEPGDPRLPFRRGELLEAARRTEEAIAAYRRTVKLDPTTALVLYKLGQAYRRAGDRHRAVYFLEQAVLHSGESSALHRRADRAIETLIFPVVTEAGLSNEFCDGSPGEPRTHFGAGDVEVVWWARIGPRYFRQRKHIVVRWIDPDETVREEQASSVRRPFVEARLRLGGETAGLHGDWRVEALLGDQVVDRRTFTLTP